MDFILNGLEMRDFSFLNVKRFCTGVQDGDGSGGGPEFDFCSINFISFIQVTGATFNLFVHPHLLLCGMRVEAETLFHKVLCDPGLSSSLSNMVVISY